MMNGWHALQAVLCQHNHDKHGSVLMSLLAARTVACAASPRYGLFQKLTLPGASLCHARGVRVGNGIVHWAQAQVRQRMLHRASSSINTWTPRDTGRSIPTPKNCAMLRASVTLVQDDDKAEVHQRCFAHFEPRPKHKAKTREGAAGVGQAAFEDAMQPQSMLVGFLGKPRALMQCGHKDDADGAATVEAARMEEEPQRRGVILA
jgi:hypothetical protein